MSQALRRDVSLLILAGYLRPLGRVSLAVTSSVILSHLSASRANAAFRTRYSSRDSDRRSNCSARCKRARTSSSGISKISATASADNFSTAHNTNTMRGDAGSSSSFCSTSWRIAVRKSSRTGRHAAPWPDGCRASLPPSAYCVRCNGGGQCLGPPDPARSSGEFWERQRVALHRMS